MILILPLLFSWVMLTILKESHNYIISIYSVLLCILYSWNTCLLGLDYLSFYAYLLGFYYIWSELFYKTEINYNKSSLNFYLIFYLFSVIFIFHTNSLLSFFLSIELISFIMITYINLYIKDKYPGILYYLFSGIFTSLFILSYGYLYLGYIIAYNLLILVFIFKLGLGPLHILMPLIYNSLSPNKIVFIDIICKFLLFYIFHRLFIYIPISLEFIGIFSLIIGVLLALKEKNNLLNWLVYSSISNYGLLLLLNGSTSLYFSYLIFYSFMVIIYLYLLSYIWIDVNSILSNKLYIFYWTILILNLIGIPPFTGFWIKFYLLQYLMLNSSYLLIFIILLLLLLLSSVYIRILLGFLITDKKNIDKMSNQSSHIISSLIILMITNIWFY